jgi:hypothetical protein
MESLTAFDSFVNDLNNKFKQSDDINQIIIIEIDFNTYAKGMDIDLGDKNNRMLKVSSEILTFSRILEKNSYHTRYEINPIKITLRISKSKEAFN